MPVRGSGSVPKSCSIASTSRLLPSKRQDLFARLCIKSTPPLPTDSLAFAELSPLRNAAEDARRVTSLDAVRRLFASERPRPEGGHDARPNEIQGSAALSPDSGSD